MRILQSLLHKQEDLLEQFREVCPNYETVYHTFNDFSDIERILTNLSNRKITTNYFDTWKSKFYNDW